MDKNIVIDKQWIVIGSISGISAGVVYPILLTVPLPGFLEIFFAGMFGILVSLSGFPIHRIISRKLPNAFTQIASYFIFVGGVLLNLMLVIQLNFTGKLNHLRKQPKADKNILNSIGEAVAPIHLAFDVSWDFFLGIATILFSVYMLKHPSFGKIWGTIGLVLAVTLLIVEFSSFPFTPYDLGLPYIFGPMLSLWYMASNIQCFRKRNDLEAVTNI